MNNVLDGVLKGPERLYGHLAEPSQPTPYVLLPATDDYLGGVKVPNDSKIKVDNEGNIDVELTKADVGLGNVDNTSDLDKPISAATQAALDNKANIDGAYEGLTAGNAEQLISSVTENDNTPYLFRTTGGSVDVGNRKNMSIVGGTLVWNQEITDGGFQDSTKWKVQESGATLSINNGVATATLKAGATAGLSNPALAENLTGMERAQAISGHTYLLVFDSCIVSDAASAPSLGFCIYLRTDYLSWNMSLRTVRNLTTVSDENLQWQHHELVVPASGTGAAFAYFGISQAKAYLSANEGFKIKNFNIFDISIMLPKIYSAINLSSRNGNTGIVENSTNASTFIKLFMPKIPYAKSSNQLVSVKTAKHITTGFNQWDEEWELGTIDAHGNPSASNSIIRSKNYSNCIGDVIYSCDIPNTWMEIYFYDSNKNFIARAATDGNTLTPQGSNNSIKKAPKNARYFKIRTSSNYGTVYNYNICISIRWDGERDGDYEKYVKHEYPLSDIELRGVMKVDGNGSIYYDGDVYEHDGTITRKYGIVDLGTLTWAKISSRYFRTDTVTDIKAGNDSVASILINTVYKPSSYTYVQITTDSAKIIGVSSSKRIGIYDSDKTSLSAADFKSAMSGIYLVYELATPTTETVTGYADPMIISDWGTEEFVDERAVPVPVGNESKYQPNLRAKLEMAPDSPDGDGDYLVRQSSSENKYFKLPSLPSTNGVHKLICTVSNGTPVLSWVAEE